MNDIAPDPEQLRPIPNRPNIWFLKYHIHKPNTTIGEYTYYESPNGPEEFERNILYHNPNDPHKLTIGKFCAISQNTRFIMTTDFHINAFSAYPFSMFLQWQDAVPKTHTHPKKTDTVVGNDVLIGYDATIMPGITIGDGAIIGARSIVTKSVAPYTIVAGNPAKPIRRRFDQQVIHQLLQIKWWDWDIEKITRNLPHIANTNIKELKEAR